MMSKHRHSILIGQSYFLRFDPKLWQAMQPFPPLGSLYAASYLRSRGYAVAFFDAMLAQSELEWEIALQRQQPRYAVLYEDNFNYLSKMCLLRMRQAAFTMLEMARQHGCIPIVCGADATDHPEDYLAHGAQVVIIGEGEHTLGELLDYLEDGSSSGLEGILGLAWAEPGEPLRVTRTPRRPDIRDLDALPFPAWDLVDISRYRQLWLEKHGYFAMNMVTTRGCPFHCNWCAKPIWGQRYNVRSPQNVVEEMKLLRQNYQPDFISFVDDIFGLRPGWLDGFAGALQQAGLSIPFKCLSRVDLLLRPGEIAALQRAGARLVWVGAESGSQKVLDAMEKGTRVEQIYQASQGLRQAGIQVGFFLQFGYPGETLQDIESTLQMVRDCQPDDIGMSVSYPLPGTSFYQAVRQQLGERQNWVDSEDLAMLYAGTFPTQFYRQLHIVLHSEFRARKAWQTAIGRGGNRSRLLPGKQPWRGRALARAIYYRLRLPVDRWKLERLAGKASNAISPWTPELSPEQAAQPSPQSHEAPEIT
jgi:radical SAM superfamily enzyme YgiQ (UPF0313 family)